MFAFDFKLSSDGWRKFSLRVIVLNSSGSILMIESKGFKQFLFSVIADNLKHVHGKGILEMN